MNGQLVGDVIDAADGPSLTREQRRSWRITAFGHADLTPAHKLVLLALETFADFPSGFNARPGVARLAEMCGLKPRAVEAALQSGRALGLIEQTGRANPKRGLAASYRLLSTRTDTRVEDGSTRISVRVESDVQPARNDFQPARNDVSTRTSVQPTNPDQSNNTEGRARGPLPDEPRCDRHQFMFNPPPCNDCKRIRVSEQRVAVNDRSAIREAIDRCQDCDDAGRLVYDHTQDCLKHPNFRQARAQ